MSTKRARIAIVGGGAIGAGILFQLANRHDFTDVVLFEKSQLGAGSTSKSAGGVRNTFTNDLNIEMGWRNLDFYANFEEHVGVSLDFHQTGYMYMYHSEEEEAKWRDLEEFYQSQGIDAKILSPEEVGAFFPEMDTTAISGALHGRDCAHVDPATVTQGFAKAATDAGARVETKTEVTDIVTEEGEVTMIETDTDTWEVDYVVNAAGPWAEKVGEMVGVDIPIDLMIRRILVTNPVGVENSPLMIDDELQCYFKSEPNGSLLVCDREQDIHDVDDPAEVNAATPGYDYYLDALDKVEQLVPALTDIEIINGWAGLQSHTPDHHAILGPTPVEGFFLACGFSGHGVQQAPTVGAAMADLLVEGETDAIELDGLALSRFTSGGTIEPEGMT